jgi:hypothetical protein
MGSSGGDGKSYTEETVNRTIASLAVILNRLLGKAVRMEGLLALMIENCKTCSGFPDQIQPLKKELDSLVTTVEQMVETFTKETK